MPGCLQRIEYSSKSDGKNSMHAATAKVNYWWINLVHESYSNNNLILRIIHDDEDTEN